MRTYYVYVHKKKGTEEVFYVGVGSGNRAWDFYSRNDKWFSIFNEYGCDVEVIREGFTDRYEAIEFEITLQKEHNPEACLQFGGGNLSIASKETRRKQSKARIGSKNGMYGREHTEEAKRKMSKRKKGKQGRKLYDWEVDLLIECNKKKIINCRGEVFNSLKEAFPKFQLKTHTSISQCLNGKQKTAGKYPDGTRVKWKYYIGEENG